MLDAGASVNFYMFYGGTNFGFTAGANDGEPNPAGLFQYISLTLHFLTSVFLSFAEIMLIVREAKYLLFYFRCII